MSKQRGRKHRKSRSRTERSVAARSKRRPRSLYTERLEDRRLLSVDMFPFHNGLIPTDVTGDYRTSPRDALAVINYLNANGSGQLAPNSGAPELLLDAVPDNNVTPSDALSVINALNNGEGQPNDIVAYYLDALDMDGVSLSQREHPYQVEVGEDFQIQVSVQDLRPSLTATGVFAGYLDVGYSLPQGEQGDPNDLFTIVYGETKRMTLDPRTSLDDATFTLTFDGQTTGPISLINGDATTNIKTALEGLNNIDPGDVRVTYSPLKDNNNQTINAFRWDIQFVGQYRRADAPVLTGDFSNLNLTSGTNRQDAIDILYPARITNPETFRSSFIPSDEFPNGVSAYPPAWPADPAFGIPEDLDGIDDDSVPNEADEVGSFSGRFQSADRTGIQALIGATLTADTAGVLDFTGNIAELLGNDTESGASDTLVFDSNIPVDPSLIDFTSAAVSVTIIQPVNAIDDTFTVGEDTTTALDVLDNDFLARDQTLKPQLDSITVAAQHGTATIASGMVTYTPDANYFGPDTFTYKAVDGVDSDTAVVTITVTPDNDAPTAVNDESGMPEDGGTLTVDVLANDSPGPLEDSIDSLTIQSVGATSNGGTATIVNNKIDYTPAQDFFGTDTFQYTAVDQGGLTATATVTITVTAVNDAPIAMDDGGQMDEDGGSIDIDVLANDSPGPLESAVDSISIQSVGAPDQGGGVSIVNDTIRYTPAANFFGTETFTYTIVDSGALTDTATVRIAISPINDGPIAISDTLFVDEMTTDNVLLPLVNDAPGPANEAPPVDSLIITMVTTPNMGGTVAIAADKVSLLYTPEPNSLGPYTETFDYTIADEDGLTDTATITINVEPVIRPRARDDQFGAQEDSVFANNTFDVMANDLFNDTATQKTLSITAAGLLAPQHGQIQVVDQSGTPVIQYQPDADFFGTDTFEYQIDDDFVGDDGPSDPDVGLVTVTVSNVNDPPVPTNDNFVGIQEDSADNTLDVLANDKAGPDNETEAIHVAAVTQPAHGTVVIGTGGANVMYTPDADYFGADTFTYTVSDGALEADATVTLTVDNVNDPPQAADDAYTGILEDSSPSDNVLSVLDNDVAGPANELESIMVVSVTQPSHGTVTIGVGGANVMYTPDGDYFGPDSFTYTIADDAVPQLTDTATVTLSVDDVNDPPQANPDTGADQLLALKNFTNQALDVLANDSIAPDVGEELTIVGLGQAGDPQALNTQIDTPHGTAQIAADGKSVVYTPDADYEGLDTFRYRIADGRGGFAEAIVEVDVVDAVPSDISGTAFLDVNNNGVKDASELALAGVEVTLIGTNIRGDNVNVTVTTDTDGIFRFDNVLPNATEDTVGYQIDAKTPEFMLDGQDRVVDTVVGDDLNPGVMSNDHVDGLRLGLFGTQRAENNYMFGERGLTSPYLSIAAYLASGRKGLAVALNDLTGDDYWFSIMQGWEGVTSAHVDLADDLTSATLTVVDTNGQKHEKTLSYRDYRLAGDRDTGDYVIYFNGSAKDLGFNLPGEGELGAADVPSEGEMPAEVKQVEQLIGGDAEQYAQAVDAVFGGEDIA